MKPKVLLIGWDAADWKAINPLMDAGMMPNLQKMVEEGVMGNLATLDPPLSPTLWTSISTGKRPYKHGIIGFTEPDPSGTSVRPVHITSRKVKAIWNMLTQEGYKTHQVGWWPSHPAEPINGVYVSNFYQRASAPITEPWPLLAETVHPAEKADLFAALRLHPHELTHAHLLPFLPNGHKMDQSDKKVQGRINSLRKIIADCTTIHSAVTYILDQEEWDFVAVYYDAIDHFGHGFMKFHPPKQDHISQKDFDAYHNVVTAGYQYHDLMLGRLLELAGKDTTVMLVSDHGFHPDHLRPKNLPRESAGPAWEHSPYGIVVMKGPGIKKDERIYGASLIDVTPTLLHLMDLPIGLDMDGKVLSTAFAQPKKIKTIESWEKVEGECGMHPKDKLEDPEASKAALDQLVELGYIEAPGPDEEKNIQRTINDRQFYLSRAYIDGGKYSEAIPILEDLQEKNPTQSHYSIRLANCYLQTKQTAKARKTIQHLRARQQKPTVTLLIYQARIVTQEGNTEQALEYLKQAEKQEKDYPGLQLQIGNCYRHLKEWEAAMNCYNLALQNNPEDNHAWHGKGLVLAKMGQQEEAVTHFLKTIGLRYFSPNAHRDLGDSLLALKQYGHAAKAYEVAIHLYPRFKYPKQQLVELYENQLPRPERAAYYKAQLPDYTLPEMVIVSGLPRSGTSMMMQMLEAGGMEAFTDGKRSADDSNQKGYYEHEAVKKMGRNTDFLAEVGDKFVKVVAHLLFHLPRIYRYKIIFMERDIDEVLQSQHKMLQRDGKLKKGTFSYRLGIQFEETLKKVKDTYQNRPNVEFLFVPHREVIEFPQTVAKQVQEFLEKPLDLEKMAMVVDASLYREKSEVVSE
ncbi:MAG: alkaline phosphatase family protein [Chitinophagales bacterium]